MPTTHDPAAPSPSPVTHRAARIEDAVRGALTRLLRRRGWQPWVLPYTGYGSTTGHGSTARYGSTTGSAPQDGGSAPQDGGPADGGTDGVTDGTGWVRVLARVLLCPPAGPRHEPVGVRGWRRFLSAPVAGAPVRIRVGTDVRTVASGRGGYLDVVLPATLPAGPGQVELSAAAPAARVPTAVPDSGGDADGGPWVAAPVHLAGPDTRVGLVSDLDDTVMVTAMPRPLLAFWNTFVRHESARRPVPGMARLYQEVARRHPGLLVVYVSTGAWNVAPAVALFLARHGFPAGPLLMTDWGPTADGWFRSGREHKRTQLRRLVEELPQVSWLLVGDDGQHDPGLYREVAGDHPGAVRAVAIRQLSATEQVLTHGTPLPPPGGSAGPATGVPELRAPDGRQLLAALRRAGVLPD